MTDQNITALFNIEQPIKNIEEKKSYDGRSFQPHEIIETEEWNSSKRQNEKWFVQLDCKTNRLKRWKLSS